MLAVAILFFFGKGRYVLLCWEGWKVKLREWGCME